jgi:hypothetical protein
MLRRLITYDQLGAYFRPPLAPFGPRCWCGRPISTSLLRRTRANVFQPNTPTPLAVFDGSRGHRCSALLAGWFDREARKLYLLLRRCRMS